MSILLDTHAVLWYVESDSRLSDKSKVILDPRKDMFFSIASLWEIAIKLNVSKLQITSSFSQLLIRLEFLNIEILPINTADLGTYMSLPLLNKHRDPFDRILVAQSINYSLPILSSDEKFNLYPIERVWT
ncbi:type II toxin-antitoxin system VapC family toxin [Egbenema bharatensis]|uniref:type II toxin-antitoxin system VapC family toxin n=1 Tax=Egbenema bharatensis TaxID=3463334 RepID=UPI003A8A4968